MNLTMDCLAKYGSLIHGFSDEPVPMERVITLPIKAGTLLERVTIQLEFLVVKILVAYDAILGWPSLCALNAVVPIKH